LQNECSAVRCDVCQCVQDQLQMCMKTPLLWIHHTNKMG
jgi:hypothetical protein